MTKKIAFICSILLLIETLVYAGLTITPSRQEISVAPGGKFKGVYTVRNDYQTPVDVKVEFRDWFVLAENKNLNISDWLSVSPSKVHLLPGEMKNVEYKVHISKSAKGVLVGMVSFVPETQEQQGINLVISVSIFITVSGTEKINAYLDNMKFSRDGGNLQVSVEVQNKGNVHLRPEGKCVLESGNSQKIEVQIPQGRPVYPGMSRTSVGRIDINKVPAGKYSAMVELKSGNLTLSATAQVQIDEKKNAQIIQ